jgi:uncharacterized protein (DUF488 family)
MTDSTAMYTIGTQGYYHVEWFITELKRRGVTTLVDVRASPYSWNKAYNRWELHYALQKEGIQYVWEGERLGGLTWPTKPKGYDEGIQYLKWATLKDGETIAVMCMEAHPDDCHRGTWIAVDAAKEGLDVHHIIPNDAKRTPVDTAQQTLAMFC